MPSLLESRKPRFNSRLKVVERKFFMTGIKAKAILMVMMAATLTGCNKDEEITIDSPDDNPAADSDFTVMTYLPAPGQFINESASGFKNVTTMQQACDYAGSRLHAGDYVSLGAWGGIIVVSSAQPIENSGEYDFAIAGNAFDTSNEPGIVWVMEDVNGNGQPDDVWYELKGSDYGKEGFERNYRVTYYRPTADNADIRWEDSNGDTGYVRRNTFHKQPSYYPAWVGGDSYTLYGSRLPERVVQNPSTGVWSNEPFKWGYVDNSGEDSMLTWEKGKTVRKNFFRISDAVDADGNSVKIDRIHFIKVQTAVNGNTEVTGENSTEVCGFYRL